MIRLLALLVTLIGVSLGDATGSFQTMRDNKNDLPAIDHIGLVKRPPIDLQNIHERKDLIDIDDNFLQEDLEKRGPLRGKQEYLVPDFEDGYFKDDNNKRAPKYLQNMREKKAMSEDDFYKRAPMGFQGMRGKKSLEEVLEEIEKRTPIEFQDTVRGNQMYLLEYPEEYEKRAMTMGFQGMRGKKEAFPVEWEKRAPMGFVGMRGKKALYDEVIQELEKRTTLGFQGRQGREYVNDNYLDYFMDPIDSDKRAPMGFQGMRGKKDSYKRAPMMGFQGMRGKRNTVQFYGIYGKEKPTEYQGDTNDRRDGVSPYQFEKRSPFRYFGIRGKKNPRWEIRGKFVGVRGKKWAAAPYVDNGSLKNVFDNIERIDLKEGSTVALDVQ